MSHTYVLYMSVKCCLYDNTYRHLINLNPQKINNGQHKGYKALKDVKNNNSNNELNLNW